MRYVNESATDRIARIVVGAVVLGLGIFAGVPWAWLWDVVGALLLATGLSGFCLVYRLFGIDTAHRSRI
ncbi:MAG: DUF2892 domain-containing protein [Firmicutes bacterium]|nr:DUF2892 domain-containing protein [Alicyclobacillaceae bacterium]MCL6496030.1 DUF2892 domain-containing protein [Bacillota bacterium]